MDMKCGHFIGANAAAVTLILGFVPDYFLFMKHHTNPTMFTWMKSCYDDVVAVAAGRFGMTDAGTGDWDACADANNGFIPYDASGEFANIESPIPGIGKIPTAVLSWQADTAATQRSATAVGTIILPAVRNGYCYECTTTGTTNDTEGEPVWPTVIGDTVTETDGVVWTCRAFELVRNGGKGIVIGATLNVDNDVNHFVAFKLDKDRYLGDCADGDLCII